MTCDTLVTRQRPNCGMWRAKADSCTFSKTASAALKGNVGDLQEFYEIGS
jgi:hypothetical protein